MTNTKFWETLQQARQHFGELLMKDQSLEDSDLANMYTNICLLEDGEIGPRERKSLERTRNRLGISAERAKEIKTINKKGNGII